MKNLSFPSAYEKKKFLYKGEIKKCRFYNEAGR
jgi:hypothetical protein